MSYDRNKTIHGKGILDIEVDEETGEVVSVWFNCLELPFKARRVRTERADDMRRMYEHEVPSIKSIDVDREDGVILRPLDPLPKCKNDRDEDVVPGYEYCKWCLQAEEINKYLDQRGIKF